MSIRDLNAAEPGDNDFAGEGAGEIRQVIAALQAIWPQLEGLITKPSTYNQTSGNTGTLPNAADFSQLFADMAGLTGDDPEAIFPLGFIGMWSGNTASIPEGWALCDGNGGTPINGVTIPDLRDRFIQGAGGAVAVGDTGAGELTIANAETSTPRQTADSSQNLDPIDLGTALNDHTLTTDNLPVHSHGMFTDDVATSDVTATGPVPIAREGLTDGGSHQARDYRMYQGGGTARNTGRTGNEGLGEAVEHAGTLNIDHVHTIDGAAFSGTAVPPYFALNFIIYVGPTV